MNSRYFLLLLLLVACSGEGIVNPYDPTFKDFTDVPAIPANPRQVAFIQQGDVPVYVFLVTTCFDSLRTNAPLMTMDDSLRFNDISTLSNPGAIEPAVFKVNEWQVVRMPRGRHSLGVFAGGSTGQREWAAPDTLVFRCR